MTRTRGFVGAAWGVAAAAAAGMAAAPAGGQTGSPQAGAGFTSEQVDYARRNPEGFQVVEVSIERVRPSFGVREIPPRPAPPLPSEDEISLDQIVNIARKIWQIIKENEPVVNVTKDYANAVPRGIERWEQLSGWKPPEGTIYAFRARNRFGGEVVHVRYQVVRTWGGGLRGADGVRRGRYLTGVTVEPLFVEVAWGYKLDMGVKVPTVVNAGEDERDPLAGMTVNLEWSIRTPLQATQGVGVYYVRGDGFFKEIGGPFRNSFSGRTQRLLERLTPAGTREAVPAGGRPASR